MPVYPIIVAKFAHLVKVVATGVSPLQSLSLVQE